MSVLHKIITLSLVLLCLVACSDDESSGDIVRRIDEDGNTFSPAAMDGSIEYLSSMKPEKIRVVKLDYDLSPIDSFEVPLRSYNGYVFEVSSRDYESPYVKLVTVFKAQNDKKMEFEQYVNLIKKKSDLKLNLYAALAANRIKTLVQKNKYDFDKAQKTAFGELEEIFDVDLDDVNKRDFDALDYYDHLKDFIPYIYCRHEISDSVFYSDFKKFRKTFGEKGEIDSLWLVKAADAWLATFEIFSDSADYLFRSVTRDSVNFLYWMDEEFFSRAYGIELVNIASVSSDSVLNTNKASAFYGRTFLLTDYVKSGSWRTKWRLKSVLEDSLGACLHKMFYYSPESILRNDTLYMCRTESHIWEIITDRDTLFNRQHGECSFDRNVGKLLYLRDSLFICECKEGTRSCSWSDKYATKKFSRGDSLYAAVLDIKAAAKYGKCEHFSLDGGPVQPFDSVFVQCSEYKWKEVDSLNYYLGDCTYSHNRGKHLGAYYGCADEDSPWEIDWVEITPPVYYDSMCTSISYNEILKFDNDYYVCETDECVDSNNHSIPNCYAVGSWRKMTDAELVPPVLDLKWCEQISENEKLVYDGVVYECQKGKWNVVDKKSLVPPEKEGLFCDDSLTGEIKRYGADYYVCGTNYKWRVLSESEAAPHRYRDSLGTCDTISNKILYWNEGLNAFYGCTTWGTVKEWNKIDVGPAPYSLPSSFNKKKFAGGSIEDSVYKVTVDGVGYQFDVRTFSYTQNLHNMILRHVEINQKGYDAYLDNGTLFLHGERGKDSLLLIDIENKSASFDDFYVWWKNRTGGLRSCSGKNIEVLDENVSVIMYGENSYMNYEKAKTFCPEGFHIPSETEFDRKFWYSTAFLDIRNDSPIRWTYTANGAGCSADNEIYADIFWTNTEKNSDTQYCYGTYMDTKTTSVTGLGVIECPKDLYPMVQVICIMDD